MTDDIRTQALAALECAEMIHDEASVQSAAAEMARKISRDLAGSDPIIVCAMNGGLMPTAMLLPHLDFPLRLDYVHATRYREKTRGEELHWQREPVRSFEGQHVLIVDDILDEGHTLESILDYFRRQRPASLSAAVLVEKEHDRGVRPPVEYLGLKVPDRYVFGCGMDYKGYWRNLPAIHALPADAEGLH